LLPARLRAADFEAGSPWVILHAPASRFDAAAVIFLPDVWHSANAWVSLSAVIGSNGCLIFGRVFWPECCLKDTFYRVVTEKRVVF
jgi:hypothetical protein